MNEIVEKKKSFSLFDNSRFYILSITVSVSLIIFFVLRITIVDARLRGIRLQQIYGLMAVSYWYVVLLMSAGSKLIGKKSWVPYVLFTRRALGAGVAYFASLHFYLGVKEQLEGWHGIWLLPGLFKLALLFGFTALLVLLCMAALSIDKFVGIVKFKQWKWLGRISYVAGMLVVVHVWIIGTHASSLLIQLIVIQLLLLLFAAEGWRLGKGLALKGMKAGKAYGIGVTVFVVLSGLVIGMWALMPSYSSRHQEHLTPGTAIHAH